MKQNLQITLTVLSGVILAGLLAGCPMPTTKEDIAKSATEYNLVTEKAGNEMLLLNIVRASKRRPMYFTSFSKLTRNMSFEVGTGSIEVPFDRLAEGSISPAARYTNSPLFDLSVLDTQEFTNGIMKPVPMSTIEYYWSQGWPEEMLLYLFIRRIDIIDPKNTKDPKDPNYLKPEISYINCPGDPNFPLFQEQIQVKNWEWGIKEAEATSIGEVDANEASKLKNLIEVQKAGLKLMEAKKNDKAEVKDKNRDNEDNNKMKLCLNQKNYVFTREATKDYKIAAPNIIKQKKMTGKEKELFNELLEFHTLYTPDSRLDNNDGKSQITIYLRSPEAILYYLGEITRSEIQAKNKDIEDSKIKVPWVNVYHKECKVDEAWLFRTLKTTDKDKTPGVFVDYEGSRYIIPGDPDSYDGCCTDQSMHVLSLVSQLIGLQKKSTEAPKTTTVSVIGR